MPGPDLRAINASVDRAITPAPSHAPSHAVQALRYALQAADAINSANAFRTHGEHETNPMMAPFSHGGAPTMMAGFGIGDLLRHALLRHASQGTKNTADAAQAVMNALGILQTNNDARRLDTMKPPGVSSIADPPASGPTSPPPPVPGPKPIYHTGQIP